jgi:hypothetical protein
LEDIKTICSGYYNIFALDIVDLILNFLKKFFMHLLQGAESLLSLISSFQESHTERLHSYNKYLKAVKSGEQICAIDLEGFSFRAD